MNKKIFAVVMSVIFVISMLSGTIVMAGTSVTENNLVTGVGSITNTDYQNQSLKSIVAFFTDDYEAEEYETPEDIIILDIGTSIQESYPITIPTEHKDYIVVIFNGIGKVSERTVITLPHDHISGDWVNTDPDNHWKSCTIYGCNEKLEIASHQLPGTTDSDCTTPVLCECGYEMEAGKPNHTYTDDFDLDCDNAGCTYTRPVQPVNVTFDVNGGNALTDNVLVTNESGKLSDLPVPTRNEYNFDGWYTSQTGGTKIEANSTVFTVATTVYAHWTSASSDSDGGDSSATETSLATGVGSITNTDYQNQSLKSIVAFFTDNHQAVKYETPEDIIILDIGTSIQESYPITIPAEHKDYIVIIFNGIDKVSERTVVTLPHAHIPGDWVNTDPDNHWKSCTKYGCNEKLEIASHQLPGTTDSDCTTPVLCECGYEMEAGAPNHTYTDDSDLSCNNTGCTYTRPAQPLQPVNVTFDVNGGNALTGNVLVTNQSGKLSNLPVPTRNGYSFDGWYTSQTGGTKIEANSTVFTVATTVYAHWTSVFSGGGSFSSGGGGGGGAAVANPTYTITFVTNGGTAVDAIKGATDLTIYLNEYVTSKEGYVFAGWCEDAACNNPIENLTVKSNAKVYAKWIPAEDVQPGEDIPQATHFEDVSESDWYYDAVAFVRENNIMNGVSETEFAPHNTTTRAMLVTMLYRLEGEPEILAENSFSDVAADSYYEKAVVWASNNEIAGGYGDGIFGAENPITREQLASILYRYAAHKGYDTDGEGADLLSFDDASEISEYAYPALAWACKNGIINGDGNKLMPTGSAERCQVAAMLMRFSTLLEK